jgi:hypothetical protein
VWGLDRVGNRGRAKFQSGDHAVMTADGRDHAVARPPKTKMVGRPAVFFSTEILTDREMTDREKTVDGRPKLHMLFSFRCRDRPFSDRGVRRVGTTDGQNHRQPRSQRSRPPTEKNGRPKLVDRGHFGRRPTQVGTNCYYCQPLKTKSVLKD